MRKLLLIAAPLALLASPVLAQSSTGNVIVNGAVASRCLFTTNSKTITITELAQTGTGAGAGSLDAATVNGRNETLVGWCNSSASTMTVTATPLTNVASVATGFVNRVDYTATANANSVNATDTSVGALAAGTPANVGLFTGNVLVTLSAASTAAGLLVAGAYAGNVAVTLAPAI
ncbi:MAG TPA: hypothetical protein VHG29_01760 [Novosphingobium sp.]|nr:hypothetical protein [Novosphingobium sp.]